MTTKEPPLPAQSAHKRRKFITLFFVIVCAAGAGYYGFMHTSPGTTHPPQNGNKTGGNKAGGPPGFGSSQAPVVISEVIRQDMDIMLNALGTVTASAAVTVRSRVDGPLLRIHFQEGQMVQKGDLLAEIDPKPFEATLAQMVGQRVRDEALLENARLDLERYQTLLAQDSIAKQQVDTQQALVKQYEGTVQTDKGAEDNARLQLGYTRITAPASGRIGLSLIDPGNIISTSDTTGIAVITQIKPINVIYTIPEDALPGVLKRLNAGEKITVTAWDRQLRNKLAEGTVLALDNQIDPTTGTVKIKALFKNEDGLLYPSQFVNIKMHIDRLEQVPTVPIAAIQRGQNGTFVYEVLGDSTVKVRNVKTGSDDGTSVVILEGLSPGQHVVIDGADSLRDGLRVEAVSAAMREAATTPAARPVRSGSAPSDKRQHGGGGTPSRPLAAQPFPDKQTTPAPAATPSNRPQ